MTPWQKRTLLSFFLLFPVNSYSENPPVPPVRKYAKVLKGKVPSDPKYLDYVRWYVDHSVVSVIVRGENAGHLYDVLSEIKRLQDKQVLLGNVIVVGRGNIGQLDPATAPMLNGPKAYQNFRDAMRSIGKDLSPEEFETAKRQLGINPALSQMAADIKLGSGALTEDAEKLLTDLGIEYSPAWIVRYHGKNYIYDGVTAISKYFANGGQFLDGAEDR